MMATQSNSEKKFRIHFPLQQISAPVVTHLVTEFDLSPNLLRADIDAKNGGWLVLGLTGDDLRLQSALTWLRDQGLEVIEEH
ncbi:MAG: NIL domain-containing protein [Janthinobacterium lividum]